MTPSTVKLSFTEVRTQRSLHGRPATYPLVYEEHVHTLSDWQQRIGLRLESQRQGMICDIATVNYSRAKRLEALGTTMIGYIERDAAEIFGEVSGGSHDTVRFVPLRS